MTNELDIFVDEKNIEDGGREILKRVRKEWNLELVRFKVRKLKIDTIN